MLHESLLKSLDTARDKINAAKADTHDDALKAALEVEATHNVVLRTIVRVLQGDEAAVAELTEDDTDVQP